MFVADLLEAGLLQLLQPSAAFRVSWCSDERISIASLWPSDWCRPTSTYISKRMRVTNMVRLHFYPKDASLPARWCGSNINSAGVVYYLIIT